jgi:hypothetical protein
MTVDQPRNDPAPLQIDVLDVEMCIQGGNFFPDPDDRSSRDQQVPAAERFWSVQLGVAKKM